MLLMLTQQLTKSAAPESAPHPPTILPIAAGAPPSPVPPTSSPAVRLPREVSIQEFCTRYNIPATDEAKLVDLEFVPGDRNIMKLTDSDWIEAGFKKLGWLRVLEAHARFLAEIRKGEFA